MLDYIRELVENEKYDKVVWDTAPGGHTLRLLKLPGQFIEHMNAAVRIYSKLKKIKETGSSVLDTINRWKDLSQKVVNFLQDRTEFILVTIPEALSLQQVERILRELAEHSFSVNQLVINSVLLDTDSEFLRARIAMQRGYIRGLVKKYAGKMGMTLLPLLARRS